MPETAVELIDRQVRAYNARDIAAFLDTYSPDAMLWKVGQPEPMTRGHAEMEPRYRATFQRSPRLHVKVHQRIVLGNKVIDHEHVTGLNGADQLIEAVAAYEVTAGLISQVWFVEP